MKKDSIGIEKIYEDDNVLVINKPHGLVTHPDGKTKEDSVSSWFVSEYPDAKDVGEIIELSDQEVLKKPGIVHRLDRDTSGVLILAKNQETFLFVKKQFQDRVVSKVYRAFVYGNVKEDKGTIDRPIGRSAKDFRLRSAQYGSRGKKRDAVTDYKVLGRSEKATYVELTPKTGRTHQLRVHLKAINHSIICDKLYAPNQECLLGFNRLALHAHTLELEIEEGKKMIFEAPLPEDFIEAENKP